MEIDGKVTVLVGGVAVSGTLLDPASKRVVEFAHKAGFLRNPAATADYMTENFLALDGAAIGKHDPFSSWVFVARKAEVAGVFLTESATADVET